MALHTLHIKVIQAHNLMAADTNGFSDPYAVLSAAGTTHKTQYLKTTLNPKWDESFTFEGVSTTSSCNVRVKDWNRFSADKFLGSADIHLKDYVHGKPTIKWFPLQYNDPKRGAISAGQILLIIHLAEKGGKSLLESVAPSLARHSSFVSREGVGKLLIEVVEGRTLAPKDITGLSDPYCVIKAGTLVSKTNIKEQTLDPVWNEEFAFEIGSHISYFTVELFDWDQIGRDDPMGIVVVSMKDLENEQVRDDWFTVKPQSNETVSGQLHLRCQFTSPQNSQRSHVISRDNYVQLAMILTSRDTILITTILQIYESQELVRAVAHLFNSEKKFMILLGDCLKSELDKTPDETSLFLVDSPLTKIAVAYFKWVNQQSGYLKTTLLPVINFILDNPTSLEVDPERTRKNNVAALQDVSQRLFSVIFSSEIPAPIREVLAFIKLHVSSKFSGSINHAIGRILFLRFICSAILAPDSFGLVDAIINNDARRALTLAARVLQNLAIDIPFGEKEPFMIAFNSVVDVNRSKYESFIISATKYPREGDEHKSYPINYSEADKIHNMSAIVKNFHNNFAPLSNILMKTKELSNDPARAAEVKIHLDELSKIFAKYIA